MDNIELDNVDDQREQEQVEQTEENDAETSFTEQNESIQIFSGSSNPRFSYFTVLNDFDSRDVERSLAKSQQNKELRRDAAIQVLRIVTGENFKDNGVNSRELFDGISDAKFDSNGKLTALEFKGKDVKLTSKGKLDGRSANTDNKDILKAIEKAKVEYNASIDGVIDESSGLFMSYMAAESVQENVEINGIPHVDDNVDYDDLEDSNQKAQYDAKIAGLKVNIDRGLLASYGLNNNIQYVISLPSTSKIMVAQSRESVEGYSLRDVNLMYETIESNDLYSQALAEYADTDFPFEHITHLRLSNWRKDQTDINEIIDVPRKSMRAIVMLFKHADTVDSEEYIFPKIKKVEISIDGDPNAVYSKGMKTNDLYREAKRVFNVRDTDMMEERFYDNKFALVIDLRNNSDNSAMGSGCKVLDNKTGVQLAITKEVTTKDVKQQILVLMLGSGVNWDASPVSFPSHTGVLCLLLMYCMRNDYVVTND